jgi:Signal peptidase (SPase) II
VTGVAVVRVAIPVFVVAFAADLLSKEWATSHAGGLVFNNRPSELPLRILVSLVTLAGAFVLAWLAGMRGLGRQWGLWIGVALLVAGILANGVSALLWARGVPDFIGVRGWVWNVADFEIAVGLTGGIISVGVSALAAYTQEQVARRRPDAPSL